MKRFRLPVAALALLALSAACTAATPSAGTSSTGPAAAGPTAAPTSEPAASGTTAPASPTAQAVGGAGDAAALCALIIDINTRGGFMVDKAYVDSPTADQVKAITLETVARKDEILSLTPPELRAGMVAELAYFQSLADLGGGERLGCRAHERSRPHAGARLLRQRRGDERLPEDDLRDHVLMKGVKPMRHGLTLVPIVLLLAGCASGPATQSGDVSQPAAETAAAGQTAAPAGGGQTGSSLADAAKRRHRLVHADAHGPRGEDRPERGRPTEPAVHPPEVHGVEPDVGRRDHVLVQRAHGSRAETRNRSPTLARPPTWSSSRSTIPT